MVLSALIGGAFSLFGANKQADAAEKAAEAQRQAIAEARKAADEGYARNKGYIDTYSQRAQGALDNAFADSRGQFAPILAMGDKALDYYNNAVGINGEQALATSRAAMFARPEFQAAQQQALNQTMARHGNKLGSGALTRSISRDQLANSAQYVDQDLSRVRPMVSAGLDARGKMADSYRQQGAANYESAWKTGNAFIENEDMRTSAYAGAALGTGRAGAQSALMAGNAWANGFDGVGRAFGAWAGSPSGKSTIAGWNNGFSNAFSPTGGGGSAAPAPSGGGGYGGLSTLGSFPIGGDY